MQQWQVYLRLVMVGLAGAGVGVGWSACNSGGGGAQQKRVKSELIPACLQTGGSGFVLGTLSILTC